MARKKFGILTIIPVDDLYACVPVAYPQPQVWVWVLNCASGSNPKSENN